MKVSMWREEQFGNTVHVGVTHKGIPLSRGQIVLNQKGVDHFWIIKDCLNVKRLPDKVRPETRQLGK